MKTGNAEIVEILLAHPDIDVNYRNILNFYLNTIQSQISLNMVFKQNILIKFHINFLNPVLYMN